MQHNTGGQELLDAIGNTPLVRLRSVSEATGCDIYGKAEFMNPGGSVKDRAALAIIEQAEADGRLAPGGLIVEGTAGNTGIGLTMVGNAKGYRSVIVMPETQSQEKKGRVAGIWRRSEAGTSKTLQGPRQLRTLFRTVGKGTGRNA